MEITYDPTKNAANIQRRGLSCERAADGIRVISFRKSNSARLVSMKMPNKPLTTPDGELREDLTDEELARFRPASEVLPASLRAKLRGRPKAAVTKERITIRLSPDVVSAFRATGDGWQTRMDAALDDWLKTHDPKKIRV